ncbi:ATP-binding cassette domain-containing protein [Microbacterium sp. CJ88]|uniref:ABC transporter ATP-binding protein n=1 Tax=Microbacterium sp. CJ88 TaxID=3445672 RepID=UPI003F65B3F9
MPDGQLLEFSGLTKRFGAVEAVAGFTARVEPGQVTGFLGPNGAGKTTTLRMLLGLIHADAGTATIGGARYASLREPLRAVGAVLEASSFHPGRSAANHLKIYAQAAGLPVSSVDRALGLVGLADVAGRKVGGFSLGMRQRLGLAYALLGDPGVLVLDEPANGLDPEGIKWLRGLLRDLAREGRTVLVSSHLLAEVQQTVDALLIIARGRLVFQGGLDKLTDPSEYVTVVDSPDRAALVQALRDAEVPFEVLRSGLTVRRLDPAAVGVIAAAAGVPLSSLQRRGPALEEVFLDLVNGVRVHSSAKTDAPGELPAGAPQTDAAPAVAVAGVTAAEAVAEPEPEPVADPEPVAEPEPVADPEPVAEPETIAEPEAVAEPVAEPEPIAEPVEASSSTPDDPSTSSETENATEPDDTWPPSTDDAEPVVEPDAVAEPVDPSPPTTDDPSSSSGTDTTEHHTWAVATTGVIDVVPAEFAGTEASDPAPSSGSTFAVASTGLIDIVPPADADPDVEAIGDIDDALTEPDGEQLDAPANEASDHPEHHDGEGENR